MSETNYSEIAYKIVDSIKSKCMNLDQVKEILYECIQIIHNPTIRYIEGRLFNLEDICYAFEQSRTELIALMERDKITYIQDSSGNLYIDSYALDKICMLLSEYVSINNVGQNNLQIFNDEIKRDVFKEDQFNIKNKRISPWSVPKQNNTNKENQLQRMSMDQTRVSAEIPRITTEW